MVWKNIILRIFQSENPKLEYEKEKENLKNVEIISFDGSRKESFLFLNLKDKYGDIEVKKLAEYENLQFYSKEIKKVGYFLEMDTNVASYIDRLCKGTLEEDKKRDILEIIQILDKKRENFQLGANLYIWENVVKGINDEIIVDTMRSVNYAMNHTMYKDLNDKKLDDEDKKIKKQIEVIKKEKEKLEKEKYFPICSLLLKVFCIKISKKNIYEQVKELVDFINETLCMYMENEVLLCLMYLLNDKMIKDSKFFKTEKNSNKKNVIKNIKGMAWDLLHFRMKQSYLIENQKNIIKLPIIITADKGMSSIIEINKMRFFSFYKENENIDSVVIYENNVISYLEELKSNNKVSSDKILEIFSQLYDKENITKRIRKRDAVNYKILFDEILNNVL
jgi:hypothetical protein